MLRTIQSRTRLWYWLMGTAKITGDGFKNKLKQGGHILSHSMPKSQLPERHVCSEEGLIWGCRVSTALLKKVDASKGGEKVTRDHLMSRDAGSHLHQLFQKSLGSHCSPLLCLYYSCSPNMQKIRDLTWARKIQTHSPKQPGSPSVSSGTWSCRGGKEQLPLLCFPAAPLPGDQK